MRSTRLDILEKENVLFGRAWICKVCFRLLSYEGLWQLAHKINELTVLLMHIFKYLSNVERRYSKVKAYNFKWQEIFCLLIENVKIKFLWIQMTRKETKPIILMKIANLYYVICFYYTGFQFLNKSYNFLKFILIKNVTSWINETSSNRFYAVLLK